MGQDMAVRTKKGRSAFDIDAYFLYIRILK